MSRIKPVGYAAIIDRRVREIWEPKDDAEFRLWWTEQVLAAKPEPVAFSPLYTADQIREMVEEVRGETCADPFDGWDAALDAILARLP